MSLKITWRNEALNSGETKIFSFTSKRHPNSLPSCCCSLPVPIMSSASFPESKPLSQLRNGDTPLARLRLEFLSFSKSALLPNFSRSPRVGCWSWESVQVEGIFSIAEMSLGAWLSKQLKPRRRTSGYDCTQKARYVKPDISLVAISSLYENDYIPLRDVDI
jgi:hypothetical protein